MNAALRIVKPDTVADCANCPLREESIAYAEPATSGKPRIFIVGEGPGKTEVAIGRPFVGESGRHLNDLLSWQRLLRPTLHITNSTMCLPKRYTSSKEFTQALTACAPRLASELQSVPEGGLVIAMGGKAIRTLTGRDKVKDWIGYPLPAVAPFEFLNERGVTVFPTYHPSYILREPRFLPAERILFERAIDYAYGRVPAWVWPQIEVDEGPDMREVLTRILAEAKWIGVDVETAGKDPYGADLLCIGIAARLKDGKVVGVSVIWPCSDRDIRALVLAILALAQIQKVYQNGNYDLISLEAWRVPNSGSQFDTLVAHRILAPQLPHDLGFMAILEFPAPRWKTLHGVGDDRKGSAKWAISRHDSDRYHALRDYNAKDAIMTLLLRERLAERLAL